MQKLKVKVCLSAKGLSPAVVAKTYERLIGQLEGLGAEIAKGGVESGGENCCLSAECLRRISKSREIDGVVDVKVLRFGPMVTLTVTFYDTVLGKEIRKTKAKAPARRFPAKVSLKRVFKKGLDLLGEQVKARRLLAEKKAREEKAALRAWEAKIERERLAAEKAAAQASGGDAGESADLASTTAVVGIADSSGKRDAGTWYWVGGGLAGGGLALVAVGVYYLVGPLQDALDKRDAAFQSWAAAVEPSEIERFEREILKQDSRANDANLIGWVGTGVGAAMVASGVLVMVLLPSSGASEESTKTTAGPVVFPGGGGFAVRWNW